MPTILEEPVHTGEHIVSEANGFRSRTTLTIAASQTLSAAAVVGIVTASGEAVELDPDAVDGSEAAAGVIYSAVTTEAGETEAVAAHVRDCELRASSLVWPAGITTGEKDTAIAELKALGVILR